MKIIVLTAKGFDNDKFLSLKLDRLSIKLKEEPIIATRRSDRLPRQWCFHNGVEYLVYHPGEEEEMLNADALVTFGEDAETRKMVKMARKKGIKKIAVWKGEGK